MAKTKNPPEPEPKATFGSYQGKLRPFSALFFLVLGTLLLLSLIFFDLDQSPFKTSEGTVGDSFFGKFGELVPYYVLWGFGLSAWVIAIAFHLLGYLYLFRRSHLLKWPQISSLIVFTFSVSIFGTLAQEMFFRDSAYIYNDWNFANGLGGMAGNLLYGKGLKIWLGEGGTIIVNGAVLIISLLALFTTDLGALFERIALRVGNQRETARKKDRQIKKDSSKETRAMRMKSVKRAKGGKGEPRRKSKRGKDDRTSPFKVAARKKTRKQPAKGIIGKKGLKLKIVAGEKTRKARKKSLPGRRGNFIFPTQELLAIPPERDQKSDKSGHEKTAEALIQTLANFNVEVTLEEILNGPVITRYEVVPEKGVKVGKILGLSNDIALGLKALGVRIQAPVPGKGTVGIEVPNKSPESVYLRDIIESEDWANSKADIPIALGKEVSGRPLIADLTTMPHLLVAGATGSGKTVCINSIIASLLYHSSPEDVRFIMVDPKIVEMQVYNDLPHMLIPVVTEPKRVPGALKWLISEMERRYQVFAKMGVRNIAGFNDKQKAKRKEEEEQAAQLALKGAKPPEDPLGMENIPEAQAPAIEVPRDADIEIPDKFPYIVCFIDELADLMMVAQKDVETSIARLAQLARAAGIHLIIATQRPSVNVITGIIKANLPCRIAFKVSSKVDSRTILDEMGAEQLIGRGICYSTHPGPEN